MSINSFYFTMCFTFFVQSNKKTTNKQTNINKQTKQTHTNKQTNKHTNTQQNIDLCIAKTWKFDL